jgi:hypothetical protein
VGAPVSEGIISAIISVNQEDPVWKALLLEAYAAVNLSKFWNTAEIHHEVSVLNGPGAWVCRRWCSTHAKKALEDVPLKGSGFHKANLNHRISGRTVCGIPSQF